jgi:hypothetical protein
MKIKKRFLMGAVLCILLPVFFGCGNDRDTFIDPFIGIWKEADDLFWEFRIDGTGGTASTKAGPFGDDFSFFVYDGQGVQLPPPNKSLVLVYDPNTVYRFEFTIEGKEAVLTQAPTPEDGANIVTLKRVKGSPQALELDNILIGEWVATWDSINGMTWSLRYRTDGTLRLFHHQVGHQFENGYAVRGNTLVIFGYMRFGAFTGLPVIARIVPQPGRDNLKVIEGVEEDYPIWNYIRVENAPWLPEDTETE